MINHWIFAVACGAAHTVLITDLGVALSWGMNSLGQCGFKSEVKVSKPT